MGGDTGVKAQSEPEKVQAFSCGQCPNKLGEPLEARRTR